jgi:NADH:ubiquinone oxidoreductase subunit E
MGKKHEISICMGSSCFSRGNNKNLEVIEKFIKENGLEAEIKISGNRCQGFCSEGPNITIDGKLHSKLDEGATLDLLKSLKDGE